jgi:hypothetical protein
VLRIGATLGANGVNLVDEDGGWSVEVSLDKTGTICNKNKNPSQHKQSSQYKSTEFI